MSFVRNTASYRAFYAETSDSSFNLFSPSYARSIQEGSTTEAKVIELINLVKIILKIPVAPMGYKISSKTVREVIPVVSPRCNYIEWVINILKKYPETGWLADGKVCRTEVERNSWCNFLLNRLFGKKTYSEQLFGEKLSAFDKAIHCLQFLELILDGSEGAYLELVGLQLRNVKFPKEHFDYLHEKLIAQMQLVTDMPHLELKEVMEFAYIFLWAVKSKQAEEVFNPLGAVVRESHDFKQVIEVLQAHPKSCPTFERFTEAQRKLFIEINPLPFLTPDQENSLLNWKKFMHLVL